MKQIFNFITILLLVAMVGIGCTDDSTAFQQPDNTIDPSEPVDPSSQGYLSFANFSVVVEGEGEIFNDEKSDEVATKSVSSVSEYTVKITRESDGEVIYFDTYANTTTITDPMIVNAGIYNVEVYSCDPSDIPIADWYCPEYYGSKSYTVGNENVTSVGEVTCVLANVMVSVTISADVVKFFDPAPADDADKLQVLLECGDGSLTFYATDEGKEGYFTGPEDGVISIYLTGMYNQNSDGEEPDYIRFEKGDWTQTITGVKAGQYRDIDVKIDYNGSGSTLIVIEITPWVYDDEIKVNATSSIFLITPLSEEILEDPDAEVDNANAPVVTLDNGLDIADTYTINSLMFDADAETYSPIYKAIITPKEGSTVDDVSISISSTSESLGAVLSNIGFDSTGSVTLYEDGAFVATSFSDYISMRLDDSSDALFATIKYKGILELSEYMGIHTIKVTTTDSKGRVSYTTLTIASEPDDNTPQVVWLGGYDFDTRYEIYAKGEGDENNPEVALLITSLSAEGLTALSVTINGEVLTPEILDEVGLSSSMDLVNADETLQAKLGSLNLPVGDEIKGQSSVTVDITNLISLLAGVGYGESDFVLEVGDANGTTTKTVMVVRN